MIVQGNRVHCIGKPRSTFTISIAGGAKAPRGIHIDHPLQLTSQDVKGNAVFYASAAQGGLAFQHTLNSATGSLTITAPTVNSGVLDLFVGVRPLTSSDTADPFDVQRLRFEIHVPPVATSDTAIATFERQVTINILANDASTDGRFITLVAKPPSFCGSWA